MSIACQSREVVARPTVGFQQQQQQQKQQQDAVIRGLSCISIYKVPSNLEGRSTDAPSLRALGVHEILGIKGEGISQERQAASKPGDDLGPNCREDNHLRPKGFAATACSSASDDDSLSTCTDEEDNEASGDMEVEGKLKGPLDSMAALEDSLPIKRGLSNFFSGKSRSFTCLTDVVSVKDLAKPESPYNRRRRALLGCGNNWERNRFYPPRNTSAGISKKPMHSSKSTLALAVAMSKSDDSLDSDERDIRLPPLPSEGKWQSSFASPRSFSLTDLQGV